MYFEQFSDIVLVFLFDYFFIGSICYTCSEPKVSSPNVVSH